MTVRGYLPPEEPNRLPHNWIEGQEAHRFRTAVVPSPKGIIITGRENIWDHLEMLGLERVPDQVAEEALAAWQGETDRTVEEVLEDWDPEGPAPIPDDLEGLDYHQELIPLAKEHGVLEEAESRSREDLITALEAAR